MENFRDFSESQSDRLKRLLAEQATMPVPLTIRHC